MSSSGESDSDQDTPKDLPFTDMAITDSEACKNYEEAGKFVLEETEQISLAKYGHLLDHSNDHILEIVLQDLSLPYELADFQIISLHTLFQKRDLLLLSPTGSGKGNLIESLENYKILLNFGNACPCTNTPNIRHMSKTKCTSTSTSLSLLLTWINIVFFLVG